MAAMRLLLGRGLSPGSEGIEQGGLLAFNLNQRIIGRGLNDF